MNKINFIKKNKFSIYIYPILSVILFSLSYTNNLFWLVGMFFLVPLIKFIYKAKNKKELLFGLFVFSFFSYSFLMSWLWSADVFSWTGISSFWFGKLLVLFYINYFVLLVGVLPFMVFFYLFYKFKKNSFVDILFFSSLWVSMEWLRTFIYSVVNYGNESLLGSHSTFCFIGYLLGSNYNLLQLAQFGGVYLLSFLVIVVNFLIYWNFFKSKINFKIGLLFFLFFIIILYFPLGIFEEERSRETKVSILQTKNESFFETTYQKEQEKFKIYEKLLSGIKESNYNPNIIVFPEDTRFTQDLINQKKVGSYYQNFFGNHKPEMIIDSSRIRDKNDKVKLRLYYYDLINRSIDKYDKILLTPGGEYLPQTFLSFFKITGLGSWSKGISADKYTKGEDYSTGRYGESEIGGIFCFEIISPEITRKMTKNGANLFVNPASHASFNENKILYNQILNMTKVRAVENNRYFIQAGNYIPSSVISNKGRVKSTGYIGGGFLNEEVNLLDNKTIYSRFGNWVVFIAGILLLIFFRKDFL